MKGVFSHITVTTHFYRSKTCKCIAHCLKGQGDECSSLDGKILLTEYLLSPYQMPGKKQYIFVTKYRDCSPGS